MLKNIRERTARWEKDIEAYAYDVTKEVHALLEYHEFHIKVYVDNYGAIFCTSDCSASDLTDYPDDTNAWFDIRCPCSTMQFYLDSNMLQTNNGIDSRFKVEESEDTIYVHWPLVSNEDTNDKMWILITIAVGGKKK